MICDICKIQVKDLFLMYLLIGNWSAIDHFSLEFFVNLYEQIGNEIYTSLEEECQFLPFKTEFLSLQNALKGISSRSHPLNAVWYIGWYVIHILFYFVKLLNL